MFLLKEMEFFKKRVKMPPSVPLSPVGAQALTTVAGNCSGGPEITHVLSHLNPNINTSSQKPRPRLFAKMLFVNPPQR